MTTRKRWSNEEVEYLLDQVSRSPENLLKAFESTAKKINRTTAAVNLKYYSLKKQGKIQKTCFTLVSNNTYLRNGKNSKAGTLYHIESTSNKIWKKILSLFK